MVVRKTHVVDFWLATAEFCLIIAFSLPKKAEPSPTLLLELPVLAPQFDQQTCSNRNDPSRSFFIHSKCKSSFEESLQS